MFVSTSPELSHVTRDAAVSFNSLGALTPVVVYQRRAARDRFRIP